MAFSGVLHSSTFVKTHQGCLGLETSASALTSLPTSTQKNHGTFKVFLPADPRLTPQTTEPMAKLWDHLLVSCVITSCVSCIVENCSDPWCWIPGSAQDNFSCRLMGKWTDMSLWECAAKLYDYVVQFSLLSFPSPNQSLFCQSLGSKETPDKYLN